MIINFLLLFLLNPSGATVVNNRPVIGVVAEDYYGTIAGKGSYIAASYVKWLESAGARVLPIFINKTEDYYDQVLDTINGVVFPGGAVHIDKETGYGISGRLIYKKILAKNQQKFLPLWGTCLGMELVLYAHLDQVDPRSRCSMQDKALPLELSENRGRLFGQASEDLISKLTTEPVNIHYHNWCLTKNNYEHFRLDRDFEVLGYNNDDHNGEKLVTVMEHRTLPVYLTQFHPEKPQFEWVRNMKHHNIPHTLSSVIVGQYFSNFFVNECRRSQSEFPIEREKELIYFYPVSYTGSDSIYVESYLFD